MFKSLLQLSLLSLFAQCWIAPVLAAELAQCDGIWTDKVCEGRASKTIEKAPEKAPPSTSEKLAENKRLILQDLVSASYDAREKYDVFFSHRTVEQQCAHESVSLEKCQSFVEDAHTRLMAMVKLASEETSQKKPSTTNNNYKTSITIVQPDRDDYIHLPGHQPGHGGHRPGPFQGYRSRFK
jgi:hypothetical protein